MSSTSTAGSFGGSDWMAEDGGGGVDEQEGGGRSWL